MDRRLIALLVCVTSSSPVLAAKEVTYYYTDPTGTPIIATDASGNPISSMDNKPFGVPSFGTAVDSVGFAGHVLDEDTQFVYMKARYYDPATGRFLSADPVSSPEGSVTEFGRFHYAANNPLKFIDPTGRVIKLVENADAPRASDHSMADFIAGMKADPIGAALVAKLEASPRVHVVTPALKMEGSSSTPNSNSDGRVRADGTKSEGTGTTVRIKLGPEQVKISDKAGEPGTRQTVGLIEKGVHEFTHSVQFDDGSVPDKGVIDPSTGNPASEQPAVDMENAYREMHGMEGRREVY